METMYNRIKRMTESEMKQFVYWVYECGNRDGKDGIEDKPVIGYFGGYMVDMPTKDVMPNDNIMDLLDDFKRVYGENLYNLSERRIALAKRK